MHDAHFDFSYDFSLEEITSGINDLCLSLSLLEFLFLEYKNTNVDPTQLSKLFKSFHMIASFWYQKLEEFQVKEGC